MAVPNPAALLAFLEEHGFLAPSQVRQLGGGSVASDARTLLQALVRRNWLSRYQADKCLQGRGEDLLLGPYRLLDLLGEGGMGQVFKAHHASMDRVVALKIILGDRVTDAVALGRFYREVRAVAKLSHPNIVTAFEASQVGRTHFLVMEYVDGIDLARLVQQSGPLPIPQACNYIRQAAAGLQHAHEKGLVHRDIKPGNLMVVRPSPAEPPVIKILDFGLARLESEGAHPGRLTQLGTVVGTVDYIAPEQAHNARTADIRADIYSLGCSLFYLLTGQPPFSGDDPVEKISARVLGDAPPVRNSRPDVSPTLELVLVRMMARDPAVRYQTPAEVAKALGPHTEKEESQAVQRSPLVAHLVPEENVASLLPRGLDLPQVAKRPRQLQRNVRRSGSNRGGTWVAGAIAAGLMLGLVAVLGGVLFWAVRKGEGENAQLSRPVPATRPAAKQLLPPPLPEKKPIDLLALVKPEKHGVGGRWSLEEGALVSDPSDHAKLVLPCSVEKEYVLRLKVERRQGDDAFGIGLVVGRRQVLVAIDSFPAEPLGPFTGFCLLDGRDSNNNETSRTGRLLAKGKVSQISCAVRESRVTITVDGVPVIDWKGSFWRLSLRPDWSVYDNAALFIGSWWGSFKISQIELGPYAPPVPEPEHRPDRAAVPTPPPVGPGPAAPAPAGPRSLAREGPNPVNEAIARGVEYLKRTQRDNGTWGNGHPVGLAALPGLTLLECGAPRDGPRVHAAAIHVRAAVPQLDRTYELSLGILFLDRLGEPSDRPLIQAMALRLIAGQTPTGGWSYTCPRLSPQEEGELMLALQKTRPTSNRELFMPAPGDKPPPELAVSDDGSKGRGPDRPGERPKQQAKNPGTNPAEQPESLARVHAKLSLRLKRVGALRPPPVARTFPARDVGNTDNSNTQFAILGLWAAGRHEVPTERSLALLVKRFRLSQSASGGWGYHYQPGTRAQTPSMTGAGLLGLAVGHGLVRSGDNAVRGAIQDPAIDKGLAALARNIGKPLGGDINPYFLWTLERVGVLYSRRTIQKKDWYAWGARLLLERQDKDGRWGVGNYPGSTDIVDTCFALLFLKRANLTQDLSQKLEFFVEGRAEEATPPHREQK